MRNLWSDPEVSGLSPVETLAYVTRLLGNNAELVLWGGGNSSLKLTEKDFRGKDVDVLRVKATGANMATIGVGGFAGVRLEDVLPLSERRDMSDEEMVAYLDHTLMEPMGPRPSVETFLHAFVPHAAVLHTHAGAVLSLANTVDAARHIEEALGEKAPAVPYFRPGFPLAKAVALGVEANPAADGVVLLHHGLVTWGDDCKEAYERHVQLVSAAEEYIAARKQGRLVSVAAPPVTSDTHAARRRAAADIAPFLRGMLSENQRTVLRFDDSEQVMGFVDSEAAADLSGEGAATPDHMLNTKRVPCFVQVQDPFDSTSVKTALKESVDGFVREYRAYVEKRIRGDLSMRDPFPRVVLIPGIGMFTAGRDSHEATVARDIYLQTIQVMEGAAAVGTYTSLSLDDAFAAEYWPLELFKLTLRSRGGELAGRVALITGGARGIGRSIAERLLSEGAHVVLADRDTEPLREAERDLGSAYPGKCFGVTMDVTRSNDVEQGFREAVLRYGGLDILVSNAGIAPTGAVVDMPVDVWERSFAVNSTGHFLVAREAVRIMCAQGRGGAIVFNCTKNVLVPGPEFGAYSCAKAAEAQLARVLAIEHGADKIRVNMVNPDSVFTDLWSPEVRKDRAKAYGIRVEQLEEHYRGRTLLGESVKPEDVAESVFFLVSDRSAKTTGCMIPVDGGVRAAFPR